MNLRDRVSIAVRTSMELKRETDDALMTSLRAELAIIRTLCMLARQESGNEQSHHVEQAKRALRTVLKLAKQVRPGKQQRDEIEEVRRDILSVGIVPNRA